MKQMPMETDEDILKEIEQNIEKAGTDDKLKGWAERLDIMVKNGFTEDRAAKVVAAMMCQSMSSNEGEQK